MHRCPGRRCPNLIPDSQRYCASHQAEYETRRGTPTQRGYGTEHRRLRAQWKARIDAGLQPACTRCPNPILPGQPFELDHSDDRTTWLGPAHQHCNSSTGGRKGAAVTNNRQ